MRARSLAHVQQLCRPQPGRGSRARAALLAAPPSPPPPTRGLARLTRFPSRTSFQTGLLGWVGQVSAASFSGGGQWTVCGVCFSLSNFTWLRRIKLRSSGLYIKDFAQRTISAAPSLMFFPFTRLSEERDGGCIPGIPAGRTGLEAPG